MEGYVNIRNVEERQAAEEIIAKETTLIYRSPELVDLYMRDILTEKSDIWALGCIFYALCFISHPFQNAGTGLGILSAKIIIPEESSVGKDAHVLIHRMLDVTINPFYIICMIITFSFISLILKQGHLLSN